MHLLYCDETNLEPRKGDFLIYGGVVFPPQTAIALSRWLDEELAALPEDYTLKFNPRPSSMTQPDFWSLKERLLGKATELGARLVACATLHDIGKDNHLARRRGINTVCMHFHGELRRTDASGLVLIDRFNDKGNLGDKHLMQKFAVGLEGLPYTGKMRLNRILGFHYSAVGQSHFPSITDVALGSLRFVFNAISRSEEDNLHRAEQLAATLAPMFMGAERCEGRIPEIGLQFSPKRITAPPFLKQYQVMQERLSDWGISTLQTLSSERTY